MRIPLPIPESTHHHLESLATEDQLFEEALFEAPTEPRHSPPTYPPEADDSDWDMPTVPDGNTLDVHAFDDWDPDERG